MVPPTAVTEATAAPGSNVTAKDPEKDTILTPRFYTTDFEAMAAMDLRPNEAELEAIAKNSERITTAITLFAMVNLMELQISLIQKLAKCSLNF